MKKVIILETKPEKKDIKDNVKKIIKELFPEGFIKKGERILIKPNLVSPHKKATTNIKLIQSVVDIVKKEKGIPIIGESSGYEFETSKSFDILGINKIKNAKLVNFDECKFTKVRQGKTSMKVPKIVLECDKIINLPKFKMHSITIVSLGLKNLFGIIHRETRRKFHISGLSKGIVKVNQKFRPYLTIVDGINIMSNKAVFGKEVKSNILIAGRDTVSVDEVCCRIIGINSNRIKHIKIAKKILGNKERLEIKGIYKKNLRLSSNRGFKKSLHNSLFWLAYLIDFIASKIDKKSNILVFFHWYFGKRPVINQKKCTGCKKCIQICPANAIKIHKGKAIIDRKKCQKIRCFKCVDVCKNNAIMMK